MNPIGMVSEKKQTSLTALTFGLWFTPNFQSLISAPLSLTDVH